MSHTVKISFLAACTVCKTSFIAREQAPFEETSRASVKCYGAFGENGSEMLLKWNLVGGVGEIDTLLGRGENFRYL